jgi:hypothetical protein
VGTGGKYHVQCIVTVPQQFLCRAEGIWDGVDIQQGSASIFSVEKSKLNDMSLKKAIFQSAFRITGLTTLYV